VFFWPRGGKSDLLGLPQVVFMRLIPRYSVAGVSRLKFGVLLRERNSRKGR
jgi:hypothetical protein